MNFIVRNMIMILLLGFITVTKAGPTFYGICFSLCYAACVGSTGGVGALPCIGVCGQSCGLTLPTPTP